MPSREAPISSQVPRSLPWGRLEQVALHLAERKQYRDLVTFVEAWARQGTPTLPARMALCEAYIGLRLMDRAWARLEPLVDAGRGPLQAVRLTAHFLLLRGWPEQARSMARMGLTREPDDSMLHRIIAESQQVQSAPEQATEPLTLSATVRLAERFMARGALLKAQGMLERARRRTQPRQVQRVEDLLWAIAGDLTTDAPIEVLCERFGPEGTSSESTERMPNPAAHDPYDDPLQEERLEGFRQLFRDLGEGAAGEDTEDDTSVSRMAEQTELRGQFETVLRATDGSDNTEILRVVRRQSPAETTGDAASIPSDAGSDYPAGVEYEDDSLVVRTRREPTTLPPRAPPTLSALTIDKQFEHEAQAQAQSARTPNRKRPGAPGQDRRAASAHPGADDDQDPLWPWLVAAGLMLLGSLGVVFGIATLFGGR